MISVIESWLFVWFNIKKSLCSICCWFISKSGETEFDLSNDIDPERDERDERDERELERELELSRKLFFWVGELLLLLDEEKLEHTSLVFLLFDS